MDKNLTGIPVNNATPANTSARAAAGGEPVVNNMQHALPAGLTPQALNTAERFDGKGDAHSWVDHFADLASLYGWSEEITLKVARLRMKGSALRWARNRQFISWDDFSSQFLRRFGETKETAISRFESCYQLPDESPTEFADRFLQDAERAGRVEDDVLVYMFIKRLLPDLCDEAGRMRMRSIDEVVSFCNYWLGFRASCRADRPTRSLRFSDEPYPVGVTSAPAGGQLPAGEVTQVPPLVHAAAATSQTARQASALPLTGHPFVTTTGSPFVTTTGSPFVTTTGSPFVTTTSSPFET
jgi:hypothetical protein